MENKAKMGENKESGRNSVVSTATATTPTPQRGDNMADSAHDSTTGKSPAFQFYPKDFLLDRNVISMSMRERGRLITRIAEAVMARDSAPLSGLPFIGRVYWRDSPGRPAIPSDIRRAVFQRDGRVCVLCGSSCRIELDHYIPFSRGGQHTFDNLRVLCKPCNRRKGARMPEDTHAR